MNGIFYGVLDATLYALGQDVIFIILASINFSVFLVNVLLSTLIVGYGIKKRLWQIPLSFFLVLISSALSSRQGSGYALTFTFAGFSALLIVPLLLIREKDFTVTKEQKDLVKFIDDNIKSATREETSEQLRVERISTSATEKRDDGQGKTTSASDFELDFQHVKNVISRLDYFGLKENDKRQVKELENAILSAEKGEFDVDVKSRINDGLGALLKIMSKYGV